MSDMPTHAKPARRSHMWVLVLIAAACGLEVCATWTGIGARSGFPVIRLPYDIARIPTDFCLMVCMEAYAGYGLYIWLTAPGRRSGPFAMWSAIVAIVFSLTGQVAYHVTGATAAIPPWLVGFVSALPVIALLLVAILIHLVRLDREEEARAEEAARKAERDAARAADAADERTALRADLDTAREALEAARSDLSAVRTEAAQAAEDGAREAAEAAERIAVLERKLAALKPKRTRTLAAAARRTKAADAAPKTGARTMLPADFDARTQALEIYLANPQISGKDLGEAVGMKERWGQLRRVEFAAASPADPSDSSTDKESS